MKDPQFAYRHFFRWRTDGNTSIQVPGHVALWTTTTGEANG
jgi:hypothetical protein